MPTKPRSFKPHADQCGSASVTTINSGCAQFIEFLRNQADAKIVSTAKNYLDNFCAYIEKELPNALDTNDKTDFVGSGESICDSAPIGRAALILERFFRYYLLRELITTPESRGYYANLIFHCLRWHSEQDQISKEDFKLITKVSDRLVELSESSERAALDLAAFINQDTEQVTVTKLVELGRHDVIKIEFDKIWLECWEPVSMSLQERKIGPVEVPLSVAAALEPGWMIACLLGWTHRRRWEILESDAIYPSLPFD